MKKSLFILFAVLLTAFSAEADIKADWKIHMPFDAWATQVVDTPDKVYFTGRTFEYQKSLPERSVSSNSLFYYDKKGDEIVSVNERTNANGNAVAAMAYNPFTGYLLVVYTDCDIDFINDDGRLYNLPALKLASIPGKKTVNSITFDPDNRLAYVATSFGYIALNDQKHEVAESRNYGEEIQCVAKVGPNIILCKDFEVLYAPASAQRFSLDDYKTLKGTEPTNYIAPLRHQDNFVGFRIGEGESNFITYTYDAARNTYTGEQLGYDNNVLTVQNCRNDAFRICGNVSVYEITGAGYWKKTANRVQEDYRIPASSYDGTELWVLCPRKGLRSYKINAEWDIVLNRDYMRPNAPAAYTVSSFAYSPTYGLLCASNRQDLAYPNMSQQTPSNISALKNGFWKEYGFYYSGNASFPHMFNYGAIVIDPSNPNHVYTGNFTGGLMRTDLSNPSNILIFANPANGFSKYEGFIKAADDQQTWNLTCNFTKPQFSADGTMWTVYGNMDTGRAELWYWPAADRLATTSAANFRPMKKIVIPDYETENHEVMITLKNTPNTVAVGGLNNNLIFYSHNGTPDFTGDDRIVHMTQLYDQDGGTVNFQSINNLYEDTSGLVWILSQRGVFTVNPQTAFQDPTRVNRIKVARNDGTNLADYLLNEINVNSMSVDGEGRKWFSTSNGLVCTSADGRTILGEFTTDNSYLPSNAVFATCYNPDNNSIMVATEGGLVEMFPSGSGSSASEGSQLRVYPNPVEPDFFGWVRIDNIPEGVLVKITDAKGGLVKELGPARGGSLEWDVSGLNNTRVSTGVYYVLASPGSGSDGNAQVSKILVLN